MDLEKDLWKTSHRIYARQYTEAEERVRRLLIVPRTAVEQMQILEDFVAELDVHFHEYELRDAAIREWIKRQQL